MMTISLALFTELQIPKSLFCDAALTIKFFYSNSSLQPGPATPLVRWALGPTVRILSAKFLFACSSTKNDSWHKMQEKKKWKSPAAPKENHSVHTVAWCLCAAFLVGSTSISENSLSASGAASAMFTAMFRESAALQCVSSHSCCIDRLSQQTDSRVRNVC